MLDPLRALRANRRGLTAAAAVGVMLAIYELLFGRFLPNAHGLLGQDYEYFLPRLEAGRFFFVQNGWASIPWFTPFACGGLPAFANPQDLWFSVPQWLTFVTGPLTAIHVTLLVFAAAGMAGCHLLLTRRFGASMPAALLGAILFGFNGFFAYRMVIGHLTAHGFMLLPLIALLLVGPRGAREGTRVIVAGLLLGYLVLTAAQFLPPFSTALAAVCLLHVVAQGDGRALAERCAMSVAIALALGAAHISAVLHFLHQFPRTDYPLPGIPSLSRVVSTTLRLLFVGPASVGPGARQANMYWALEQHELEYGMTLIPAVILIAGAVVLLRQRARDPNSQRRVRWGALAALAAILVLPLALNYYQASWNALLKSLPLIGSTSTFLRWLCVYIPVIAVGAARALDRAVREARTRWIVLAAAALAIPLIVGASDTSFYSSQRYDPRELIDGDRAVRRTGHVPTVDSVVPYDPNALIHCATSAVCYEPIFGYRLERFPRPELSRGPTLPAGDTLNIRNPACYAFPAENHCVPGARFLSDQRREATAFVHYQSFTFIEPLSQRLTNWLSVLSLVACVVGLGWTLLAARMRVHRPAN